MNQNSYKMPRRRTIFEILDARRVCYAVNVCNVRFANSAVDGGGQLYCIIALAKDDLYSLGFNRSPTFKDISEREMNSEDIRDFLAIQEQFNMVMDNEDGKMWELKTWSFKTFRQNQVK